MAEGDTDRGGLTGPRLPDEPACDQRDGDRHGAEDVTPSLHRSIQGIPEQEHGETIHPASTARQGAGADEMTEYLQTTLAAVDAPASSETPGSA